MAVAAEGTGAGSRSGRTGVSGNAGQAKTADRCSMEWTVRSVLDWTRGFLESKGIEQPRLSAEWLLCAATGLTRVELYMNYARPMEPAELQAMRQGVLRRAKGEPLQYVTGEMPFRHLVLHCSPGVLIPRPETEILVDEVLAYVQQLPVRAGNTNGGVAAASPNEEPASYDFSARWDAAASRDVRILEVGTGTGCIALSLAAESPRVRVCATDISPDAVELATRNCGSLGMDGFVDIVQTDLAAGVEGAHSNVFDVLVSNPPYIPTRLLASLPREVAGYEPHLALDGGPDGLDVFRRLVELGTHALAPGGLLACELHEDCLEKASQLPELRASYGDIRIVQDLTHRPRHLLARLKPSPKVNTVPANADADAGSDAGADSDADAGASANACASIDAASAGTPVMTCASTEPEPDLVAEAARILRTGGTVVLPTDTVYGIAQAATSISSGARRLYEIKRRPQDKSIAWLLGSAQDLDRYGTNIPDYARILAKAYWPGALTLVVQASELVPREFLGPRATIALRLPGMPLIWHIVRELGAPLSTTSANTSGLPAPDRYDALEPRICAQADLIVNDKRVHSLVASTVVDCTGQQPRIIRQGSITAQQIMQAAR